MVFLVLYQSKSFQILIWIVMEPYLLCAVFYFPEIWFPFYVLIKDFLVKDYKLFLFL